MNKKVAIIGADSEIAQELKIKTLRKLIYQILIKQ